MGNITFLSKNSADTCKMGPYSIGMWVFLSPANLGGGNKLEKSSPRPWAGIEVGSVNKSIATMQFLTKRFFATAVLLCGTCGVSFGDELPFIKHPEDDASALREVSNRPELKPLRDTYVDMLHTRLGPNRNGESARIFGWNIIDHTIHIDLDGKRMPPKAPISKSDLVLPTFAIDALELSDVTLHPAQADKHNTELHELGDFGFVEFHFFGGLQKDVSIIYLRADTNFVALKSTNDFAKRLEWEKGRINSLKEWLDQRWPQTDLGEVEVSLAEPKRLETGSGTAFILRAYAIPPQRNVHIYMYKVGPSTIPGTRGLSNFFYLEFQYEPGVPFGFSTDNQWEPGVPFGFSKDYKSYRFVPELLK